MGSYDDDGPSPTVCLIIGITGITLFSLLFIFTILSTMCARNKYAGRLFISSTIMSALDIPRYIMLVIDEAYRNRIAYALHMFASVFFFLAFTFAIYLLQDAVDLSHTSSPLTALIMPSAHLTDKLITDKGVLIVINVLFFFFTIVACVSCLLYDHVDNFFHKSIVYEIFTMFDAAKNLFVAVAFLFYGWRVRERVATFYEIATSAWEPTSTTCPLSPTSPASEMNTTMNIAWYDSPLPAVASPPPPSAAVASPASTPAQNQTSRYSTTSSVNNASSAQQDTYLVVKLQLVLFRLLVVMGVCLISFLLRVVMLVVKSLTVEEGDYDLVFLSNYGLLWWILADFLPRSLPIVTFLVCFGGPSRETVKQRGKMITSFVRGMTSTSSSGNEEQLAPLLTSAAEAGGGGGGGGGGGRCVSDGGGAGGGGGYRFKDDEEEEEVLLRVDDEIERGAVGRAWSNEQRPQHQQQQQQQQQQQEHGPSNGSTSSYSQSTTSTTEYVYSGEIGTGEYANPTVAAAAEALRRAAAAATSVAHRNNNNTTAATGGRKSRNSVHHNSVDSQYHQNYLQEECKQQNLVAEEEGQLMSTNTGAAVGKEGTQRSGRGRGRGHRSGDFDRDSGTPSSGADVDYEEREGVGEEGEYYHDDDDDDDDDDMPLDRPSGGGFSFSSTGTGSTSYHRDSHTSTNFFSSSLRDTGSVNCENTPVIVSAVMAAPRTTISATSATASTSTSPQRSMPGTPSRKS